MLYGYGDFMWTSGTWIALPFDFTSCALSDMEVQLPVIFSVSMFFRSSEWGCFLGELPTSSSSWGSQGIVSLQEGRDGS